MHPTNILGLVLLGALGPSALGGDACDETARLQKQAAGFDMKE